MMTRRRLFLLAGAGSALILAGTGFATKCEPPPACGEMFPHLTRNNTSDEGFEHQRRVTSIDPRALAAFRHAMWCHRVDVSRYDLKFWETPDGYVILTSDKLKPPGAKWGKLPEYAVYVSRRDFSVTDVIPQR
jgi:hypothetical protein